MKDFWNILLLEFLPYIALTMLVFGSFTRVMLFRPTVQATSTQFLDNSRMFRLGVFLFHYGIVFVFLGHVFGLLTPEWMYDWLFSPAFKRLMAIVMGSVFGIMALVGMTILTIRRFENEPVSATSSLQDKWIDVWLLLQIALGLCCTIVSATHSLANYLTFDSWAQGICTFDADSWKYIANCNPFYKMHIVNGFLIFLVFPYSKLVHFLATPLGYLVRFGQQLVWSRKA